MGLKIFTGCGIAVASPQHLEFPEGIGQQRRTVCPKCGQIQTPGGYDQQLLAPLPPRSE